MLGEIIPVIDAIRANKILKEKNNNQDILLPEELEDIDCKGNKNDKL